MAVSSGVGVQVWERECVGRSRVRVPLSHLLHQGAEAQGFLSAKPRNTHKSRGMSRPRPLPEGAPDSAGSRSCIHYSGEEGHGETPAH